MSQISRRQFRKGLKIVHAPGSVLWWRWRAPGLTAADRSPHCRAVRRDEFAILPDHRRGGTALRPSVDYPGRSDPFSGAHVTHPVLLRLATYIATSRRSSVSASS